MGRNKDDIIRMRINDIVGYKSIHVPTGDLFEVLGLDPNNRVEYNHVMGIIHRDRNDFCNGAWNSLRDMLINPTYNDYERAYIKCLEYWYKRHRTLLYPYPDGWGTPPSFKEFQKFEGEIGARLVQGIVNKVKRLKRIEIQLPYYSEARLLEGKLQWKDFTVLLDDFFKKFNKKCLKNVQY